jgi:hypothetical protein
MSQAMKKRVLLAAPRGYCAGVDRAVVTVEKALDLYGAPVYVRKQIVHNKHVVATLEARGAIFVEETDEVPEGKIVVFSAHGVSPTVHEEAAARKLKTIDATCPLVTKVHHEAEDEEQHRDDCDRDACLPRRQVAGMDGGRIHARGDVSLPPPPPWAIKRPRRSGVFLLDGRLA